MNDDSNYKFAYFIKMKENLKDKPDLTNKIDRLKLDTRFKIFALFINPAFTALIHILIPKIPVPLLLGYLFIFIFLIFRIGLEIYENGIVVKKIFSTHRFYFSQIKELRPDFIEEVKGGGCKMLYDIKTGELSHINYILVDKNNGEFLIDFARYEKDSLVRFLKALKLKDNKYIEYYREIYSPFDL